MAKGKIFITGGAGFIGRWVVKDALDRGYDVTVYDNFSAGSRAHIEAFETQITAVEGDITDIATLDQALDQACPDVLIHLAAVHFIPYCNEHPEETLKVNSVASYRVLRAAADAGMRRAVVASSGAFYPSVDTALHEEMAPEPADIYGFSKQQTEETCAFIARTSSMTCVAARLFNTYGPWETNPHLIPHILESLRSGPSVELGNIHTKRDYIYVEDVAAAVLHLTEASMDQPFVAVNVGTGKEYSAKEIVETLGELLGEEITINVDQSRVRAVDKMHQRADTQRLQQMTGFGATHGLEKGLQNLLVAEGFAEATSS